MNCKSLENLCLKSLEFIAGDISCEKLQNEAFALIESYENGQIKIKQFRDHFLEVCQDNTIENKKFWAKCHFSSHVLNKDKDHWCETCDYAIVNCEISEYLMKKLIKLMKDFELTEEDKKELLSICKKTSSQQE